MAWYLDNYITVGLTLRWLGTAPAPQSVWQTLCVAAAIFITASMSGHRDVVCITGLRRSVRCCRISRLHLVSLSGGWSSWAEATLLAAATIRPRAAVIAPRIGRPRCPLLRRTQVVARPVKTVHGHGVRDTIIRWQELRYMVSQTLRLI